MSEYLGMSVRDLNRKCTGSIFRYGDTDEFYQLDSVGERGDRDRGREVSIMVPDLKSNTWSHTYAGFDIFEQTNTTFPLVGYFNYDRDTFYLSRLASRQWHVGYNSAIVKFDDMFNDERESIGLPPPRHINNTPKFINAIFTRNYPQYEEAVALVTTGSNLSVAISNELCIAQSLRYDKPLLCYKNKPIGFIKEDSTPVIFPPAEYVETIMPVKPIIMEDFEDVTLRNKWY